MNPLYLRWSLAGAVTVASAAGLVYWLKTPTAVATASENASGDSAATNSKPSPTDPLFAAPADELWKGGRPNDPFARNRSPSSAYPIDSRDTRHDSRDSAARNNWERDNWNRETNARNNSAQNRADRVLRTSYDADEPARFESGDDVKPLAANNATRYGDRISSARLTAGADADQEPTPAEPQRPADPFGLNSRTPAAASAISDDADADDSAASANTNDFDENAASVLSRTGRTPATDSRTAKTNTPSAAKNGKGTATSRKTAAASAANNRASSGSITPELGGAYGPTRNNVSIKDPATSELNEETADPLSTFDSSRRRTAPTNTQPAALPRDSSSASRAIDDNTARNHPFSTRAGAASPRAQSAATTATNNTATASPFNSLQQHEPNSLQVTGTGRPGTRQAEGRQAPQLTIEKIAPAEIQIGKPAKIELVIRNTGTITAQGVEVHDAVPEGTSFVESLPPIQPGLQGELAWTLGTLKPGDESKIDLTVLPTTEGEVGSVAMVTFRAEAGSRSRVTKPELNVQVTAAKQVMIGGEVVLSIKIANPGTGPASNVVIVERVPPGLKHAAGPELEFEVGVLKPGEQRELDLTLSAAQAGRVFNILTARGDGNLAAEAQCEIEVIAPALEIAVEGPAKRYLERQATYTVSVSNPGTAPAKEVELVTHLPRGLKFVKANNAGQYDARSHSVAWSLEELPPAETGTVSLTAIPVEAGEQRLRAEGRARQGLADEQEQITVVEGLAALLFTVVDLSDPIEVKGETTYEINITNQGSKAAENVRLAAVLPPQMKFTSADGPTKHQLEGTNIVFEPLSRLAPKADTSYRITLRGDVPGDVRMRVQLVCDDMREPVTKEESTRVYADE